MDNIDTYKKLNIHNVVLKTNKNIEESILKKIFYKIEPYLYIIPAFVVFGIFLFYPFFKTIYLSLFLTDNQGRGKIFIGLQNYINLFTSESFIKSLKTTFIFAFLVIIFSLFIGLITAILSNFDRKAFKPFKIIFSMPMAIASSSAALIFEKMFQPATGIVNKILNTDIQWLVNPKWALPVVAFTTIWMVSAINYIFISAGLKNIPRSLYESAEIDGASYFKKFCYITIPGLSPVLFFVLTMNIIFAFQSFGQIKIMTEGGPGDATNVIVYSIYRDAFFNFRFGSAASQSIILFVIILAITLIQFKYEKRGVFYK